ncbi:hypothetical protein QYM36_012454, partial [Artemia franciscana]
VKGTIFSELDDEKVFAVIDFHEFEEQFKLGNQAMSNRSSGSSEIDGFATIGSKRFKKPEATSVLEHTRLRNIAYALTAGVGGALDPLRPLNLRLKIFSADNFRALRNTAISRRKLEHPLETIVQAVNLLDLKTLKIDMVEILQRMVPTDIEVKAYRDYVNSGKSVDLLTEEDKFLFQLTKVDRLATKLNVMNYIANFYDNVHLIQPQIQTIHAASRSIHQSKKLKRLLEIVLAFGNYMNSARRGPAYGFKLQSLDALTDTKTADKKLSLLHYIAETVGAKFPEVTGFDAELRFLEKAAGISLENLGTDVHELDKGMELAKKELEFRKELRDEKHHIVLKSLSVHDPSNCATPSVSLSLPKDMYRDFLGNAESKLVRLRTEMKNAQEAFSECAAYFGESPKQLDAGMFFGLFARFVKAYKTIFMSEHAQRTENTVSDIHNSLALFITDAVISELKLKTKNVQEKKILPTEDVYHGALEDILLGLKSEPYRRADALRRSQRRRNASVRMSRGGSEEIDV